MGAIRELGSAHYKAITRNYQEEKAKIAKIIGQAKIAKLKGKLLMTKEI
jgi:hypothetical protein